MPRTLTSPSHAKVSSWPTIAQSLTWEALSWTWPFQCSEVKCTDLWHVPAKSRDKPQRLRSRRRKRRRPDAQRDVSSSTVASPTLSRPSDVAEDQTQTPHKKFLVKICVLWNKIHPDLWKTSDKTETRFVLIFMKIFGEGRSTITSLAGGCRA